MSNALKDSTANKRKRDDVGSNSTEEKRVEHSRPSKVLKLEAQQRYDPKNRSQYQGSCRHAMRSCDCHDQTWFQGECQVCQQALATTDDAYRMPRIKGGWVGCYCGWECVREAIRGTGGNSFAREGVLETILEAQGHESEEDDDEEEEGYNSEDEAWMNYMCACHGFPVPGEDEEAEEEGDEQDEEDKAQVV